MFFRTRRGGRVISVESYSWIDMTSLTQPFSFVKCETQMEEMKVALGECPMVPRGSEEGQAYTLDGTL
jgi:hypothetical protein